MLDTSAARLCNESSSITWATLNLVFLTRVPTILDHVASRTDAASTHHRVDHGRQTIVLSTGPDVGHSRTPGRRASDSRREDHRARQDETIRSGPGTMSGLRVYISRPQPLDKSKPLPALSKRSYYSTALWHRSSRMLKKFARAKGRLRLRLGSLNLNLDLSLLRKLPAELGK